MLSADNGEWYVTPKMTPPMTRHTIAPHKAKSMSNMATTDFSQNCQLKIPSSLVLRNETLPVLRDSFF